jgi:uncharacterized protein YdeI (YjbR/CyaY-like superfamily)
MPATTESATDKVLNYIETLPEWSRQLCTQLRHIILSTDASITEKWKWGPHYDSHGMVCGLGAFKQHVKLTFFNGMAMNDNKGLFNHCIDNEFSRSIKYTADSSIDTALLTAYIKESIAINRKGFKRVVKDKTVTIPEELQKALAINARAAAFFESLTYGYKKEYAEHVATARQEKTKQKRITQIVSLCAEGKTLHQKYKDR